MNNYFNKKIFVKKFGTLEVNKEMNAREVGDCYLIEINGGVHYIHKEDATPIGA